MLHRKEEKERDKEGKGDVLKKERGKEDVVFLGREKKRERKAERVRPSGERDETGVEGKFELCVFSSKSRGCSSLFASLSLSPSLFLSLSLSLSSSLCSFTTSKHSTDLQSEISEYQWLSDGKAPTLFYDAPLFAQQR